jgi:hypothetical protein
LPESNTDRGTENPHRSKQNARSYRPVLIRCVVSVGQNDGKCRHRKDATQDNLHRVEGDSCEDLSSTRVAGRFAAAHGR